MENRIEINAKGKIPKVTAKKYSYKDGEITRYSNNHVRIEINGYIKWIYDTNQLDLKAKRIISKEMNGCKTKR